MRIRMKFDDPLYSRLDEITLEFLIDENAGMFPPFNEYILLMHSATTQYYIRRSEHPELLEKLYGIALRDYEPFMGKRWH